MNTPLLRLASFLAVLLTPLAAAQAAKKTFREQMGEKMASCEYALQVIMDKPETAIPAVALKQAKGIVLVHQYRVGFIIGGTGGSGVLVARNMHQGGKWGPPVLLDTGGVNFGLQAGAKEVNTVFLLMTDEAVTRAYSGRFDVGADAAAVAGPKAAEVENFDLFKADVLVYTSTGGIYAGAAMKMGWLSPYDKGNRALYETTHSTPEIALSSWFDNKIPAEGQSIHRRLAAIESGR